MSNKKTFGTFRNNSAVKNKIVVSEELTLAFKEELVLSWRRGDASWTDEERWCKKMRRR